MVLDEAVKIVNYIKSRALNSRLFKIMCEEMGANHTQLLLHSEVRWLSRGRVLTRLFEMRHEVCTFLSDMKFYLKVHFLDEDWICHLAYLADVFSKINELNLQLQGFDINIFQAHDKVKGFYKKVLFGVITQVEKGDITTFDSLSNLIIENEVVLTGRVMVIISNHLTILANTFLKYFPEIDLKDLTNTWITNPFATQAISEANLSNKLKENLLECLLTAPMRSILHNMLCASFGHLLALNTKILVMLQLLSYFLFTQHTYANKVSQRSLQLKQNSEIAWIQNHL